MATGGIIAIVVALISVAGSIFCVFLNFRKDSNRISEVKSDTSTIKPKVDGIAEYTKEINRSMMTVVAPEISRLEGLHQNVADILEDVHYKKRLQTEYKGVMNYEQMVAGIQSVYVDNAELQKTTFDQAAHIKELMFQNTQLQRENRRLEKENERLDREIRQLSRERDQGIEL